jgi:hypothetical protein
MDHRWGMRVAVDHGVQILCRPRTVGVGRLVNISVSGALVLSGFIPPLLARVAVAGPANDPAGPLWESIEGYVVRHQRDGFGLEWVELAPVGICTMLVESARGRGRGASPPQLIHTRQDLPATLDPRFRRNG